MAFHLGSLGFLTPFLFDNFQEKVTSVLEGNDGVDAVSCRKYVGGQQSFNNFHVLKPFQVKLRSRLEVD